MTSLSTEFRKRLRNTPKLTRQRHAALFQTWHAFKNSEHDWLRKKADDAKQEVLFAYMPFVLKETNNALRNNYGSFDDLFPRMYVMAVWAFEKCDKDRAYGFPTYLKRCLDTAKRDYFHKDVRIAHVPNNAKTRCFFANYNKRGTGWFPRAVQQYGANVSGEDIARTAFDIARKEHPEHNWDYPEFVALYNIATQSTLSLDGKLSGEESGASYIDFTPDEGPNPEEIITSLRHNAELRQLMQEAIESLSEREQTIIQRRKLTDHADKLEDIGRDLGISKERVRQIECSALQKMRKHIENSTENGRIEAPDRKFMTFD